ncbi:Uncharacterised protein [Mycobacterium tuberculosis]|nr:Uncharacterised protein [Mycobacterium tuberculosis]
MPHAWATAFDQVVRPKTPRGDGNSRRGMARQAWLGGRQTQNPERGRKLAARHGTAGVARGSSDPKPREGTETAWTRASCRWSGRSSDPKPREGTETRKRRASSDRLLVVRPKTPRGDGNSITLFLSVARLRVSSDPKPREGTETRNPAPHPQLRHAPEVVRPKTPRGDGNQVSNGGGNLAATGRSSDPKPREGTETRQQSRRPARMTPVVRPKTPRGDGNSKSSTTSAAAACSRSRQTQNPERGRKREEPSHLGLPPAGRQTQNPERGRKLNNTFFERGAVESVVRPKTPRGDGNTETQHQPDNLILASSDPKPREGTETGLR